MLMVTGSGAKFILSQSMGPQDFTCNYPTQKP
jgi:hypothetical protein